jgi:hypothetical protein
VNPRVAGAHLGGSGLVARLRLTLPGGLQQRSRPPALQVLLLGAPSVIDQDAHGFADAVHVPCGRGT